MEGMEGKPVEPFGERLARSVAGRTEVERRRNRGLDSTRDYLRIGWIWQHNRTDGRPRSMPISKG